MVKYNWKKINDYFKWRPQEVLKYFYYSSMIKIPPYIGSLSKADRKKIGQLQGDTTNYSFLVNPHPLLLNHSNVTDMYNYIHIASLRSLFDYNIRKVDWVEIWQVPNTIPLDNSLLIIKDKKIYLRYDSSLTGE